MRGIPLHGLARFGQIIVFTVVSGAAQAQVVHHYRAHVNGGISSAQEKLFLGSLLQADPLTESVVDREQGTIEWKSTERYDQFRTEALFERQQLGLQAFEELGTPASSTEPSPSLEFDGPPRYIDTGDAVRDNLRYDAYKAAWIAANPDRYREMTAPSTEASDH
jgi:hypothetical protein